LRSTRIFAGESLIRLQDSQANAYARASQEWAGPMLVAE
jgi:hypothetical protein